MPIDLYVLEHLFRHRVLRLLLRERRIDEAVIRKLLGWRHSGFSLHNAVRIGAGDTEGRSGVAEYILRSPFSLEKLRYQARTGTIIYQSKMHPVLKRNFEVFSATDWLAALTAHIPNAGEHLVRYYGWYSNVNRGKRRKAQGEDPSSIDEYSEVSASAATRAWARLIKQVYEVDPLGCPRCAGPMRIIAFIEQPAVIEKILRHLALWPAPAHSPPVHSIAGESVSASYHSRADSARLGGADGFGARQATRLHAPPFHLTPSAGVPDTPPQRGSPPPGHPTARAGTAPTGSRTGAQADRRAAPKSKFLSPSDSPRMDRDAQLFEMLAVEGCHLVHSTRA